MTNNETPAGGRVEITAGTGQAGQQEQPGENTEPAPKPQEKAGEYLVSEHQPEENKEAAQKPVEFVALSQNEQRALSEILISSKSLTGITKQQVKRLLRVREDELFYRFLRKAGRVLGHALKIIYDEESNRCMALTRASSHWVQSMLDDRQLALLLFCFYLGMTSRTGNITFDELHMHFQRSSLYAERRLLLALDHLVKTGFLRQEEMEGEGDEKKRVYRLTAVTRHVFPERYLVKITGESQGGQVSMEQVAGFFGFNRQEEKEEEKEEEREITLF